MTIIGQDNRTEVTNFDQNPLDSVVAVDGVLNNDTDYRIQCSLHN